MNLEEQLQEILAKADRERATPVADHNWDSLYPSLRTLRQAREDSKTPPDWDSDPRLLTSAMYPTMRTKPGSE
jgi:hypothetical protein